MVIFLYGADTFSAKEKLEDLKRRFLLKNNGNSFLISNIEADEFDLADFRNKVLSFGFFAEKKMVILKRKAKSEKRKIENSEEGILEVIKKIPDETTLIFWQQDESAKFLKSDLGKYLLKQQFIFKFNLLSGNALISWIRERAKTFDCEIDNESALLICDILGDDLWKIDLELNKICSFVGQAGKINRKVVDQMLKKQAEENIFKFIDALASKNKRLALLTLQNEFDAGANELSLLGMIARQIRILLQIKSWNVGTEQCSVPTKEQVARELEVHPYVAQKSLTQVRNFHINELKNIYRQILAIDMSIKSSSAPARVLFDRMIAKM